MNEPATFGYGVTPESNGTPITVFPSRPSATVKMMR
jgi:hypothetical protein